MAAMKLQTASPGTWENLARLDAGATFFQTPAWHRAAAAVLGSVSAPLLFTFPGGEAVLPLQRIRGRFGQGERFFSPFGTYTALLAEAPLDGERLAAVRDRLASLNLDLFSSPFAANPVELGRPLDASTRILELAGLEPDLWEASWSRNHRRLLKQAREAGLRARLAAGRADVEAYCGIYARQARRWGPRARTVYPDSLFHSLWEALSGGPAMKLWLAEAGGDVVAGRLCFYHNRHAVEWHAAAREEWLERGANHFLVREIVADAAVSGHAWYDFNPSPGLAGVDHFKRGFGTKVLPFRGSENRVGLAAWASRARRLLGQGKAGAGA